MTAMPLSVCETEGLGVCRQVARTNHRRGVSQNEKKTDISVRRRLPCQNGFSGKVRYSWLASRRRCVIRGLRIYFERLDTIGAGSEPREVP